MTASGAYIFPSQVFLDEALRERCLAARSLSVMLDLASDTLGLDFRAILRDGTEEETNDPRFRRALINILGIVGFQEEQRRRDMVPACVTGVSLGVITATAAAGWMSLEDMMRISYTMSQIELDYFEGTDWRSVFFYNCDHERFLAELRDAGLDDLVHLSVIVSSNQMLAACRERDMPRIRPVLARIGAFYKVIPYSMPGHCDLMGDVEARFLAEWTFRDKPTRATIPVISTLDARPHTSHDALWEIAKTQYTTVHDWRKVTHYLAELDLDGCVVLQPADFIIKSIQLDPECKLDPVAGGVGVGG